MHALVSKRALGAESVHSCIHACVYFKSIHSFTHSVVHDTCTGSDIIIIAIACSLLE
jgi:hypothetical protein